VEEEGKSTVVESKRKVEKGRWWKRKNRKDKIPGSE